MEAVLNPDREVNTLQTYGDSIAGRSVIPYYACGTQGTYLLATTASRSYPNSAEIPNNGTVEVNFDITINKPTIFAGLAWIDCMHSADGPTGNVYLTFRIIHVDGAATETSLGTATTTAIGTGTLRSKLVISITRKTFKVGEKIRLECVGTDSLGGGSGGAIGFDPETAGSELILYMPVVNLE